MPQNAQFSSDAFTPDRLLAGSAFGPVSRTATLLSGVGAITRGTLLGAVTMGAATSAAKSGGNTGNGTCTVDATTPVLVNGVAGVYQVRFIAAATNNGTFAVTDPRGVYLGQVIMAAGAGTFSNRIKFAIADGATDFAVGDGFDITVAAGSGKLKKCVKTANDGSAVPFAISADASDSTSADANLGVYIAGEFNLTALTVDASFDLTTEADLALLRAQQLYVKTSIPA
jgi:hypothetical protein